MSEWKDIATAPRDGTVILVFDASVGYEGMDPAKCIWVSWWLGNFWWQSRIKDAGPSHWMPLPSPPTQETGS